MIEKKMFRHKPLKEQNFTSEGRISEIESLRIIRRTDITNFGIGSVFSLVLIGIVN
jgi:hypothetical protein